jgi:hypothetical protein
MDITPKKQRQTKNLGYNTAKTQDESYAAIETTTPTAKCSDGRHEGERLLPVRQFYLAKGGAAVQGACIVCQKNRRADRIKRAREKFADKSKEDIRALYKTTYGPTKKCSKCLEEKDADEFPISLSMETGLHNHCIMCSIGTSQGNGGLRDFIFMPDKDGLKYKKKAVCEECGGTNKLAVDHILPIAKGGTDCITNKQTLCVHCNSSKSANIRGIISLDNVCERYRGDDLDFKDTLALSRTLAKKVYDFRKKSIEDATLQDIQARVKEYTKKHNMGHDLTRIVRKIAIIFNKI